MATPVRPAASPAPPPFVRADSPMRPPLHARPPDDASSSSALARVRSSPTGDTPPCSECGKRFPSWKALFGHMRCHPERGWRGITKPPQFRHSTVQHSTMQEREIAISLLMLAGGPRPGAAKGKKSILGAAAAASSSSSSTVKHKDMMSTSTSSPPDPARRPTSRCGDDDDHRCSVCARGFATGQALGGHKRCHWERSSEGMVISASATTSSEAPVTTTTLLDLNLPPPGTTLLPRKSDQGGSFDATLDLKLGY